MDENILSFSLGILKHFINDSLGLDYKGKKITGFELLNSIIDSSAHNIDNPYNNATLPCIKKE